jgi:hypothetical protein
LRKELDKAKSAFEETQNELSAWKFTPDRFFSIVVLFYLKLLTAPLSILNYIVEKTYSNTGKRLMAKCRLLYQENEELGRMISSGRLAKLEGDLALQRNFSEEMKKSQSGELILFTIHFFNLFRYCNKNVTVVKFDLFFSVSNE